MAIKIMELPYPSEALKPFISQKTLKIHYEKHHQKYVDKLNELIVDSRFENMSLKNIILESNHFHQDIFNNAAQVWNHNFYWSCLTPKIKSQIPNIGLEKIDQQFKSLQDFKKEFIESAMSLFGSGWTWLVIKSDDSLVIENFKDADTPIAHGQVPVFACDVWEHAYYLDYQNERARYLDNLWEITNWDFIKQNLNKPFNLRGFPQNIFNNADSSYR